MNNNEPYSPSSLKQKLRSSLCIIPCFSKGHHHSNTAPSTPSGSDVRSLVRTSSFSSSKSRFNHNHHHHHHHHNHHYEFAELKDKCRNLIGRMGRSQRRHSASADFKYDPLSYALNFDHEEENLDQDYPLRSFSSRLPPSPPRTSQDSAASPAASKEITACS